MIESQFAEARKKIEAIAESRKADRVVVVTDSVVDRLTAPCFGEWPRIVIEAGEAAKSLYGAVRIWHFLHETGATRRSIVVNMGGGMISDLGGFAASTFKRGIGSINLPTTLLASVDAAIGGKTGINFEGLKNEIGTFALPLAVIPLTALFPYLPHEEWLSGVGEAIKTGLLDSEYLFRLATSREFIEDREPAVVDEVVKRCAEFKEKIVRQDFKEGGMRKCLNLGHTAGHALEALKMAQGTPLPHGVAVAYGLLEALERSVEILGLDKTVEQRCREVVEKYFPKITISEEEREKMRGFMAHDKKNSVAGEPAWVLLSSIGSAVTDCRVSF